QLHVLDEQKRFDFLTAFGAWLVTALGAAIYTLTDELLRRRKEVSVDEALRTGESQTVEFKEGIDAPHKSREIARVMAAFANTNSGNIFIGIKDNPVEVVGVQLATPKDLDELQKRIREIAVQMVRPPIRVRVDCFDHQGKKVVRVFVPRGTAPVYFA